MPTYLELGKRESAGITNIYQAYNPKLLKTSDYNKKLMKDKIRKDNEEAKEERILSDNNYVYPMVEYNRGELALALKNKIKPYRKNKELVCVLDDRELIRENLESGNFTKSQVNQAFYEYNGLAA